MGRSSNSFISYVGHAEETISDDRVTLPEKELWVAVLCRAALDACKGPPDLDMTRKANVSHKNNYHYNRDQARHFFIDGGYHFRLICDMAGRNPEYVQAKVRKILLRKNGWNVDVPITSHYRQGPKRTRMIKRVIRKRGKYKEKLTGNSYYSAMGKKGGRPRMYNAG
tara:strand:- start:204 stop:704 length:501 start_codon:yes stop_codon:yes gene_type:complete